MQHFSWRNLIADDAMNDLADWDGDAKEVVANGHILRTLRELT